MSRGVRSGRLKDRLMIQRGAQRSGDWGGTEFTWSDFGYRRCEIRPLRAAEFFQASGEQVQAVYEIRFRFEHGLISETDRLVDRRYSPERYFDVQTVIISGNYNREYVVTAIERKWQDQ